MHSFLTWYRYRCSRFLIKPFALTDVLFLDPAYSLSRYSWYCWFSSLSAVLPFSKIWQTRSWIKGSRSLYLIFFCLFFCRTFCAISARARKTRDCTPLLYSLYQSQNYNPAKGGHWDKVVMDPWFGSHLSIFSLTFPGPNLIKENVSERFYLPVEYTVRVLLTIFTRKLYITNNKVETEARRIAGFNFCYHCSSQNCGSYFSLKKKW